MNTLKRQANKSKISALAGTVPLPTEREIAPVEVAIAPAQGKKRGRPAKVPRTETRSSSGSPTSMLGSSVRVAPTMQFDLRPEDEVVLAVVPTLDLIEEMVELQCRATVVSRAIRDELKRVKTVSIPKLKSQLSESSVSLKDALKAIDEARKDARLAKEEQEALKVTLNQVMAERADAIGNKKSWLVIKSPLALKLNNFKDSC